MNLSFFKLFPAAARIFILFVLITLCTIVLNHYGYKVSAILFTFSLLITLLDREQSIRIIFIIISTNFLFLFLGNFLFSPCGCGGVLIPVHLGVRHGTLCLNKCGEEIGLHSFLVRTSQVLIGYAWVTSTRFAEIYDSFTFFKILIPSRHKKVSKIYTLIVLKVLDGYRLKFLIAFKAFKIKGLQVNKFWQLKRLVSILSSLLKLSISNLIRTLPDYTFLYNTYKEFNPLIGSDGGMENAVIISNITLHKGSENLLTDINLVVKKGEFVALTGRDCSGKSTLLKIIGGYIPFTNLNLYVSHGHYSVLGKANDSDDFFKWVISKTTLISNEINSAFIGLSVKQQILCLTNDKAKANDMLCKFNLENFWERDIASLSGGETLKLLIVCSLIKDADIYLFDDLTAQLDLESRVILIDEILKLKKNGKTILISDQDIEIFDDFIDRKYLLNEGKLYCWDPKPSEIKNSLTNRIDNNYSRKREIILKLENVSLQNGKIQILSELCLDIVKGTYFVIIGKNGVGKSTLANVIAGIQKPNKGKVNLINKSRVGYVFQNPLLQIIEKEVKDELLFGPFKTKLDEINKIEYINNSLIFTELKADESTVEIHPSKGTLLEIAYTSVSYDLVILDEPTVNLDNENKDKVIRFIEDGLTKNISFIVITHDEYIISRCKDVYLLENKKLINYDRRNF